LVDKISPLDIARLGNVRYHGGFMVTTP
jgi:hypothetical protein